MPISMMSSTRTSGINEEAVNIWLYWTPYSLVADARVHGLADASKIEFGNFQPKTWLGELWID